MNNKAKIFLSSGQKTESELKAADAVKAQLEQLGFNVFRAAEVETSRELLGVIFPELRDADYLVFLDFRRERLGTKSKASKAKLSHRGSLYCHQEFAIAGFLGIDFASFRQNGVEHPSGMSSTMMGNGNWFTTLKELPQLVFDSVQRKVDDGIWSTSTRNKLQLGLTLKAARENPTINGQRKTWDYYHAQVTNLHHRKRATNCYAYLDKLVVNGEERQHRRAELKWRGVELPSVSIWNSSKDDQGGVSMREFDAFIVEVGSNQLVFKSLTDAPNFNPEPVLGAAEIEATYIVCSDQFPDTRETFRFRYDGAMGIELR
jgi:hypothetical protein